MKNILTYLLVAILILSCLSKKKVSLEPELQEKINEEIHHVPQTQQLNKLSQQYNFKYYIFEEKCYDKFFNQHNFFDLQCIKLTISKLLGYILVYGALAVKAPQILKIVMNKSIEGISFSSIIVQTFMNVFLIGYNIFRKNSFSIYGENVFLGVSNLLVLSCFFLFSKDKKYGSKILGIAFLVAVSIPLILQLVPAIIIQNSIWIGIAAFLVSRLEQVRENHKNKSTGNLSFISTLLNFGGNIARTFTVLTEAGGDTLFLISNVLPIFVNGYIVLQFIMYWNNTISYKPISGKQKDNTTTPKQSAKGSTKIQ